jgi:hypothetical protein
LEHERAARFGKGELVNTHCDTRRDLHLVAVAEAVKPCEEEARRMAEAILQLQTLRDEFEGEVLSGMPNLERVTQLIVELATVRKNVRAYMEANA